MTTTPELFSPLLEPTDSSPASATARPSVAALRLSPGAAVFLLGLCAIWGANMVAIKIGNRGFPPILAAGIRSSGAALLLAGWAYSRRQSLWPARKLLPHAAVVGALFAGEFVLLYLGTTHTSASRATILLYTNPFWTVLGAHFFLANDRLGWSKILGLGLAFLGVLSVFGSRDGALGSGHWIGDLMELGAAFLWALTTLYVKRLLGRFELKALPILFYQLAFSAPLLLLTSAAVELGRAGIYWRLDSTLSLVHQTVVVAGLSYLGWFWLMERYKVSSLTSFSFMTPLFGVAFGGLLLNEPLPFLLWLGLALVAGGIYLVNRA